MRSATPARCQYSRAIAVYSSLISQATMRPAQMVLDPGQIYDFEFAPRTAGALTLQYGIPAFAGPPAGYKQTVVDVRVK
jgi:hypothetical protein